MPAPQSRQHVRVLRFPLLAFLAAILLVVAGCADQPLTGPAVDDPDEALQSRTDARRGLGASVLAPESNNYLVLFRGSGEPADFRSTMAEMGGEVIHLHEGVGLALVGGIDGEAADELSRARWVRAVEPEAIFQLDLPHSVNGSMIAQAEDGVQAGPADAFFFGRQWHLQAIGADRAWEAGYTGSADVTVAILDSGIGYAHPDLAGRVDLERSISFIPEDDELAELVFPGIHPSVDLNFHGTHVAATVASNALAAAGVTAETTLTSVKVCNVQGSCPTGAVLMGVLHAADTGADVINMSLGGGFLKAGSVGFHSIVNQVFTYAGQQGSLMVVAAGNAGINMNRAPATFFSYCDAPHTICVSATGPLASVGFTGPWEAVDTPADYTNFGQGTIDVAGPGGTGAGPVWAACNPFTLLTQLQICATGTFIVGSSGTSMAAPHVSGLAALYIAKYGGGQPSLIRNRILQNADQLGRSGHDPFYGRGRINVPATLGIE